MVFLQVFVLFLLILLNGFLVMAELAIVSSRKARLQVFISQRKSGAEAALSLLEDPASFLSTTQIGITIVAIVSGAYGERSFSPPLAELFRTLPVLNVYPDTSASTLIVVAIAYVSLVIGELAPKRLALANPEHLACQVAPFMRRLSLLMTPIAKLLGWSSEQVLRLVMTKEGPSSDITEEEVKTMIAEGTEAGVFEKAEQQMIEGVLRVADRSVRSIMVPRPDIVWLDLSLPGQSIYEQIAASGHSRFPVSRGDVDKTIGIVHAKTLLEQLHNTGQINLQTALKTPLYVHESTKVLKLLELFRASTVHMAIVLDEHGTVQGIATPTDILEGIAGELPEDEADAAPSAVQRKDGSWLLDAQMPVFEVERVLSVSGLAIDDAEYTTLAGFILSELGRIPQAGEAFVWKDWRFEVVDLDGRRIDKVLAQRI